MGPPLMLGMFRADQPDMFSILRAIWDGGVCFSSQAVAAAVVAVAAMYGTIHNTIESASAAT